LSGPCGGGREKNLWRKRRVSEWGMEDSVFAREEKRVGGGEVGLVISNSCGDELWVETALRREGGEKWKAYAWGGEVLSRG